MPAKHLSPIGIGTYLGNADEATDLSYTRAIVRAVQLGVNVIDTAANYRFQRSERSIGEALKILANELAQAHIVVDDQHAFHWFRISLGQI